VIAVGAGSAQVGADGRSAHAAAAPVGFGKSLLQGTSSTQPTTLAFGPDGRLYVGQQNGLIEVYTVARQAANRYAVQATETIRLIQTIPNHNDDGTLNQTIATRQLTGIVVAGTAANPVVYATSSDPRIGGGHLGSNTGLDTNSGILSRLRFDGASWVRTDLVRGLPRSEEAHSTNGMALDAAANVMYVAQGGNTNRGAPSNNFARLPEYALSAAVLRVDLGAIGNTTYNLPTLADPAVDAHDPFGGDLGRNQARLVSGGPVQVFSPGFRNPYDVVRTTAGRLYAIDNGANAGWGEVPIGEGPGGTCTNEISEPGASDLDGLHLLTAGAYAGHPDPTRGNRSNTFGGQSPVPAANPIECDYQSPAESGALTTFPTSTNGIAEYTAQTFGGALQGQLLAVGFDNVLYRIKLNAAGTRVREMAPLVQNVGSGEPLDVTTRSSSQSFPGTIWIADHGNGGIWVLEPNSGTCTGADSTTLDEDGDGYSNADEIDNGTDPCSAADVPHDWDADHVSDVNDPDDDNDGRPDTADPFAIDPANGTTTRLPITLPFDTTSAPGGLLGLGFTGLMTNGTSNYASLFDPDGLTSGGAAGVLTVDAVTAGDARGAANTQHDALQLGVTVPTRPFTVRTRVLGPFAGITPAGSDSLGLQLGTGGQDDYVKLVLVANGGSGGVQLVKEVGAVVTARPTARLALPGPDAVDLFLTVDPSAKTVSASYAISKRGSTKPAKPVGSPEPIPAAWLSRPGLGLAVGLIATSAGASPFPATWDSIAADDTPAAITGFAPAAGAVGTAVAITGRSLVAAQSVRFHGRAARFTIVSPTQLKAVVPSGATSGSISVVTPLGTATSATPFTVR
jgi:hypothetical protein